jgi:predicted dehydrogenase
VDKKRYALVGTGSRADLYILALTERYKARAELVALCDTNQSRMNVYNKRLEKVSEPRPTYLAHQFDTMIAETKPEVVIVTTIDRSHHQYITRAMELGCDVITEKPMTIDAEKCQGIIDMIRRTGKNLTVTFNYRYAPVNSKVKDVLQKGEIGEVLSVQFEWLLDTQHGADYFRRWHRDKRNSGGLIVHKATHHFDLVNWWLASQPETVFGMGDLRFYGRANAEARGITEFYHRAHGSSLAQSDPFALVLKDNPLLHDLYLAAEHEDGYFRDQSVFGDGISVEDTMAVMVRYRNKAIVSYSLNAHCPWEGYRVMFNGSKGRLELSVVETSYVSGSATDHNLTKQRQLEPTAAPETTGATLRLQKHWQKAQIIPLPEERGGHGGGDVRLLDDLFLGVKDDPLNRAAGYIDGAMSILVGIAANTSFATGQAVKIGDLVRL